MGSGPSKPKKAIAENIASVLTESISQTIQNISNNCAAIATQKASVSVSGNVFHDDAIVKGGNISQNIKMNFSCLQTTENIMSVTNSMHASLHGIVDANVKGFGGPAAAGRLKQDISRKFQSLAMSNVVNESIAQNAQQAEMGYSENIHHGKAIVELTSIDQTGELIAKTIARSRQVNDVINMVVDRIKGDVKVSSTGMKGGDIAGIFIGIAAVIFLIIIIFVVLKFVLVRSASRPSYG